MQYPIPQFIEKEGKIISFLTFRQFFLLVGGGAGCFLLFFILPTYFSIVGSGIILLVVGIIAFVKINDEPIITLLLHMAGFIVASKNYTWQKKDQPYPFKVEKKPEKVALDPIEKQAPPLKMQPSKLTEAKKAIDTKK